MEDDDVLISLIEHFVYCPRQAALVAKESWTDNSSTTAGVIAHRRVDSGITDSRRGFRVHHSVALRSEALHIRGIADTIEESPDGSLLPVEHKVGSRRHSTEEAAALQAVAQALCLESMTGRAVPEAAVWFGRDGRRFTVKVDDFRTEVEEVVESIRDMLASERLPSWTSDTARCGDCSLRPSCLPELEDHTSVRD